MIGFRVGIVFFSLWLFIDSEAISQDFEVAPVTLDFALETGESETKIVSILNHGDKPQNFTATISNPSPSDTALNSKRSCAGWLSVNPSFFELNSNESQTIEVMMQVPSDGANSRWATIHIRAAQERTTFSVDKTVATGIIISPRIAIQVYQSAKSNTKYAAKLSKMKEVTVVGDTVRSFTVSVNNTGDKLLECKVYLVASNLETTKEFKAKPVIVKLKPDQSKITTLILPEGVGIGSYSLAAILDYGHRTNLEAITMEIKVE